MYASQLQSRGLSWFAWYTAACRAMGRGMGPNDVTPMRAAWRAGTNPHNWRG